MSKVKTGRCDANGASLYHEVRGSGPPVLLISGATGDAGHFESVADELADEFTVVTYDRRGNSRSPSPDGWKRTSMTEQAADAAALLETLRLSPAAVFGTSGGAAIACALLLERPDVVRGALLHEPPLAPVAQDASDESAGMQEMIGRAMSAGGPPAAVEAFVRSAAGDAFEHIAPGLLQRMKGNGETLLGLELPMFMSFLPDAAALSRVERPVRVLVSEHTAPLFDASTRWLSAKLGTDVLKMPGAHAPYFDRPRDVVGVLRPLLRGMT